jgi:hypothetical protein
MLDLTSVDRVLGAVPGEPSWVTAHRASRQRLLPTWLSAIRARGEHLTPEANAFLSRVERRLDGLRRAGDLAVQHGEVTMIKGPRIAQHFPAGVLRNSGDADLVASDEAALWRAARLVRDAYGAVAQSLAFLRVRGEGVDASPHIVLALKWAAEEPYLDKPMGVDIATCAFSGDFKRVPVRTRLPDDALVRELFTIAEERFQRRFTAKDMFDALVLCEALSRRDSDLPSTVEQVAGEAVDLWLLPQLAGLLKRLKRWVELPLAGSLILRRLAPHVEAEKARRPKFIATPHFAYPLIDIDNDTLNVTKYISVRGQDFARTPIGVFLLVNDMSMEQEELERAERSARALV